MIDPAQADYLLSSAYNAAIRAGAKIVEIYTRYDDFSVSLKADSTPITIADREADAIIKQELNATRIPLMSEEGRDLYFDERRSWDLYWLVDPLDGTEEFIKRNGEFTVNIALMVDNRPLIGVIYIPASQTIYFNHPGRGAAYCVTGVTPVADAAYTPEAILAGAKPLPLAHTPNTPRKIAMSRSHESKHVKEYIASIESQVGPVKIVEYGSSLKMCLVAEGSVDCYLRTTPTMEWDTAAGEAIARAAGVQIQSLRGGTPLLYNQESLENPPFICLTAHSGYTLPAGSRLAEEINI